MSKKTLQKAMMNDYDTRRTMEAAAMAGDKKLNDLPRKALKAPNIKMPMASCVTLKKSRICWWWHGRR